jgi:hypothetical protein
MGGAQEMQFSLRPQIGVLVSTYGKDFIFSLKYFHGFDSDNIEGQQYFTVNVGLAF